MPDASDVARLACDNEATAFVDLISTSNNNNNSPKKEKMQRKAKTKTKMGWRASDNGAAFVDCAKDKR